jgi:hypothetical protein
LRLQILEIAKRAAEKKLFPDVAERALYLSLGL